MSDPNPLLVPHTLGDFNKIGGHPRTPGRRFLLHLYGMESRKLSNPLDPPDLGDLAEKVYLFELIGFGRRHSASQIVCYNLNRMSDITQTVKRVEHACL